MGIHAFRARTIVTFAGEAPARTRAELEAPCAALDDGVLVVDDRRILAVESFAAFKRGPYALCPLTDLGEVRLAPPLINAHCHLELSHLAGATRGGDGFTSWLQSLIPLAARLVEPEVLLAGIRRALDESGRSGVVHVADVGSRNPALVAQAAGQDHGVTHLLEVFGYGPPASADELPQSLAAQGYCPKVALDLPPERHPWCAVAGHALYSTSPEGLRAAFAWCRERRRPFSMHLAESQEEDDCLRHGAGALYALLRQRILPSGWVCPGASPAAYAERLGLLAPHTLAVHCVRCSSTDVAILSRNRASVCLCPRSNCFIGVGSAPAEQMAEQGVLLCLGTDSLASNETLDMQSEMHTARTLWGFSDRAVLRMATLNAAYALRLDHLGALVPGKAPSFRIVPES